MRYLSKRTMLAHEQTGCKAGNLKISKHQRSEAQEKPSMREEQGHKN